MREIYDESGILIRWRHTQKEAICKVCRISIYSEKCPHSDPEMIKWERRKAEDILVIRTKKVEEG